MQTRAKIDLDFHLLRLSLKVKSQDEKVERNVGITRLPQNIAIEATIIVPIRSRYMDRYRGSRSNHVQDARLTAFNLERRSIQLPTNKSINDP